MRGLAGISAAALALTVVAGHLTDRTTSQPLAHVRVVASGPQRAQTTSDDGGAYRLAGLRPGKYTITLESDDVPPQRFRVTVRRAKAQTADFVACSTTLDFHCGAP